MTMRRWRGWKGLSVVCCLLALRLRAQDHVYTPEETIRVSSQLVLVDVAAVDRRTGLQVAPLLLDDLELKEDGVPQRLLDLRRDNTLPLSIVFLFDTTDSVRPVLRNLGKGAAQVLEHLGPLDEAAVMTFSSHTKLILDFARRHSFLEDAILRASNGASREPTFLNEDIFEAVDEVNRSTQPDSRRVLLWLTDGTDNLDDAQTRSMAGRDTPKVLKTEEEATEALLRSGAVSALLMQRFEETEARLPRLAIMHQYGNFARFSELTGGPVLTVGGADAAERMAQLLDELRTRSTVSFRPSSAKARGTHCKLSVRLTASFFARHPELRSRNVTVQARREYVR